MIAVGDVFVPADGDESQAVRVTGLRAGYAVDCAKVANGVTFDCPEHMLLDPLRWRKLSSYFGSRAATVADHVVPTPLPPAPNALDQAEWASVPPAPPKLGDGLRAIADMLDERERLYGPAVTTWERIARVAGVTTEQALEVMIAMKRERALFSPENPDHVRDQIGYLAILQAIRARS